MADITFLYWANHTFFRQVPMEPALNHYKMLTKVIVTTALRIPAWSPTVVLTERHSG